MNHLDTRLIGASAAIRRLRTILWIVLPFLAFCVWTRLPPPSTPFSQMMADALPEAGSGVAKPSASGEPHELSFIRSIAGPEDWVCYFWEYERIAELVRRDTGRTVSSNIASADDQRAWALVVGDQAHVMPIWSTYVRDRRRSASPPTYRKCTRLSETLVSKQGSTLVLDDAR